MIKIQMNQLKLLINDRSTDNNVSISSINITLSICWFEGFEESLITNEFEFIYEALPVINKLPVIVTELNVTSATVDTF